jgi:uncharacterized membrane protein YheB (UPF0754 family)
MQNRYLPDQNDLISLLNKEERRSLWREIREHAYRKLRQLQRKEKEKRQVRATENGAEAFGKAIDGLTDFFSGLSQNVSELIQKIAQSSISEVEKPRPALNPLDYIPTNEYRISEAAAKTLNDFADAALNEQSEEFRLAQTWVDHARNTEFIGPLPEAFEAYRQDKSDIALLNEEFGKYADRLHKNQMGYAFKENKIIFSETLIKEHSTAKPLKDGEIGRFVLAFKEQNEPRPRQTVFKLEWDIPEPRSDLVPIPIRP